MIKNRICVFCKEKFIATRGNQLRCKRCAALMGTWGVRDRDLKVQGGQKRWAGKVEYQ